MVQVFPFQIDLAAVFLGQAAGVVKWRRATYIVTQQVFEFAFEIITRQDGTAGFLQLADTAVQDFGDVGSAEFTVITV